MSILILLCIMVAWLIGQQMALENLRPWGSVPIFLLGYLALIAIVAIWGRLVYRAYGLHFRRRFRHFSRIARAARWFIPLWMAADALTGAAWARWVIGITGLQFQFPAMVIGILPAMLTWVALWWAEYPAERAMREQNALDDLMHSLPIHAPPPLGRWLFRSLRQQLLPIVAPILVLILIRDLVTLTNVKPIYADLMMVPMALGIYVSSPLLLRWLLDAHRPLGDSPLRRRLDAICKRCGLRYRDILLWRTDHSLANAAVIGLLPGWRYVLLSDRLLETMTDREIEAVFAHELGHIVHHHMLWFVVFFAIMVLAAVGPAQLLAQWMDDKLPGWLLNNEAFKVGLVGLIACLVIFGQGYLSRRFERQADVFAARMMEIDWGWPQPDGQSTPAAASHVGQKGAEIFASALHRVAFVNNIPISARGLLHPSISRRLRYLDEMKLDPARTSRFDQTMGHMYVLLILVLMTCGGLAAAVLTGLT